MRLLESIEVFPVILTLAAFQIGQACQKKWKKLRSIWKTMKYPA